jgi:rhomboid protease GluP
MLDPPANASDAHVHARPLARRWRFPVLTTVTVALTGAVTASRLAAPEVLDALRRDPSALRAGQVWRLLSPVLVQSDRSALVVVAVLLASAVVGAVAEQLFPPRRWIALYLVGALVGHGIGEVFQPLRGGTSVAFAALLGGLAAYALRRATVPAPLRIEAAIAIPLAVADTLVRDIHGLPFLAGLVLAMVWLQRDAAAQGDAPPAPTPAAGPHHETRVARRTARTDRKPPRGRRGSSSTGSATATRPGSTVEP